MRRDFSRDQLPRNVGWTLQDFIPDQIGAPLRKRGGWIYASPSLTSTTATTGYIDGVASAPFAAGHQLIAINNAGSGFNVTSTTSATSIGAVPKTYGMVFHKDTLIIPSRTGGSPYSYSGSGAAALIVSAPGAKFATVWNSRTVLGGTTGNPRTIYTSNADDPLTYDTANAFFNASKPLTGLATCHGMILAWSNEGLERFRGSNPPPGGNLIREWVADNGCVDARTISQYQDNIVWADVDGIYMTDGSSVVDLTTQVGLKHYWTDTIMGTYSSTVFLSGGVWRNLYIAAVNNFPVGQNGTGLGCVVIDLERRIGWLFSNLPVLGMAKAIAKSDELFLGLANDRRVASTSSMLLPTGTNKADGDGTAIQPFLETVMTPVVGFAAHRRYVPVGGFERVKNAYVSYDIRDAASDNPTLTLSYVTSPELGAAYTSLGTIAKTTAVQRSRVFVRDRVNTVGFKLAQTGNSADTRIYGIELDQHPQESSRV